MYSSTTPPANPETNLTEKEIQKIDELRANLDAATAKRKKFGSPEVQLPSIEDKSGDPLDRLLAERDAATNRYKDFTKTYGRPAKHGAPVITKRVISPQATQEAQLQAFIDRVRANREEVIERSGIDPITR